jgi:hypothetical protein
MSVLVVGAPKRAGRALTTHDSHGIVLEHRILSLGIQISYRCCNPVIASSDRRHSAHATSPRRRRSSSVSSSRPGDSCKVGRMDIVLQTCGVVSSGGGFSKGRYARVADVVLMVDPYYRLYSSQTHAATGGVTWDGRATPQAIVRCAALASGKDGAPALECRCMTGHDRCPEACGACSCHLLDAVT